ncbi:MAG: C40 family peptidase [Sediminibacterium sp.]|jgi:lipoprotein Spr
MRYKVYIIAVLGLFLLSGCKSLGRLTSKDQSSPGAQAGSSSSMPRGFLDNIAVLPGEVKVAGVKVTAPPVAETEPKKNMGITYDAALSLPNKYANLLGVPPTSLTNVELLAQMEKWFGTQYCFGGSTDSCIDCSSFTQVILRDVYNVKIPRNSQQQFDASTKIETENLKEGDLVFFNTVSASMIITHVGVYVCNNKFVHASTSKGVTINDLSEKYFAKAYRGAGRFINL